MTWAISKDNWVVFQNFQETLYKLFHETTIITIYYTIFPIELKTYKGLYTYIDYIDIYTS